MAGMIGVAVFVLSAGVEASSYKVGGEYEASHCEFYVDSFGVGQFKYLSTQQRFLDVYLRVNEHEIVELQGDEVLNAGAVVKVRTFAPTVVESKAVLDILDFSEQVYASRISPGTWQMRFAFEERATPQTFFKEVRGLSFYLDVRRSTGRVERLWIHDQSGDFTVEKIFGDKAGSTMSIGIGEVRYPETDSVVYSQKAACAR